MTAFFAWVAFVPACLAQTAPDLAVTSLVAPTTATAGGQINVSTRVVNQGNAAAGTFRLEFYFSASLPISANAVDTGWGCTFSGLGVGEATTACNGPIGVPGGLVSGIWYFGAIADPTNQIVESDKSNNTRAADTGPIAVTPQFDFDRDGHSDVIWQDPVSGWAQVWYLGGAQGVTTTGAANLTALNTWRIAGVGDFDRDGHPDVVWQDPVTGAAQVWFLGGPGGNVISSAATISAANSWRIMSIADFNGDGIPDAIWQDQASGWAQIWFMGGAQGTTITSAVNLTARNTWRIAGTGDFNGDGVPDVVWQDPVTGATQIWYLGGAQGNVVQSAVTLANSNSWKLVAIADFNGDGHPDVVWQDPVSGASQVWFLGGAQGVTVVGSAGMGGGNSWRIMGPH